MKKLLLLESSVVGLLAGFVVATYMVYLESTSAFMGHIITWVSLRPVWDMINVTGNKPLYLAFIFFVCVCIVYAIIIGALIHASKKAKIIFICLLVLIIASIYFEQASGMKKQSKMVAVTPDAVYVAPPIQKKETVKVPEKYFGTEAMGDLNADGVDDVAFIISRKDEERGALYYISAALADSTGHTGTDLMFLGNKVVPEKLSIQKGIITIDVIDSSVKPATTSQMFMRVSSSTLQKVESLPVEAVEVATSTQTISTSTEQ